MKISKSLKDLTLNETKQILNHTKKVSVILEASELDKEIFKQTTIMMKALQNANFSLFSEIDEVKNKMVQEFIKDFKGQSGTPEKKIFGLFSSKKENITALEASFFLQDLEHFFDAVSKTIDELADPTKDKDEPFLRTITKNTNEEKNQMARLAKFLSPQSDTGRDEANWIKNYGFKTTDFIKSVGEKSIGELQEFIKSIDTTSKTTIDKNDVKNIKSQKNKEIDQEQIDKLVDQVKSKGIEADSAKKMISGMINSNIKTDLIQKIFSSIE